MGDKKTDVFDGLFGDLPAESQKQKPPPPPAVKAEQQQQQQAQRAQEASGADGGTAAAAGGGAGAGADSGKKRKAGGEQEEAAEAGGPKRTREEEEGGKEGKGTVVDLGAALQKISGALRSSKPEKFRKAGELLLKLMADMDESNRSHFHTALAFFMAEEASWERLVGSPEDRALSEKIFGAVQQRILLFSPEEQYRAATWILLGSIRPRLFTDDTFDFRRAMRELREYVTCLQPFDAARDAFADGERRRAVLAALGTALKRGLLFQWAKPSVEEAFALATERRMQVYPDGEREALDEMATQLRAAKHGQSVGGNVAGSVVARSVRLADSMSTPWNRKAGDIFR